jgi:hypothetical protein
MSRTARIHNDDAGAVSYARAYWRTLQSVRWLSLPSLLYATARRAKDARLQFREMSSKRWSRDIVALAYIDAFTEGAGKTWDDAATLTRLSPELRPVIGVLCKVCSPEFAKPFLGDRETGQDATQWMRVVRNHIDVPFVLHKAARLQFREMPSKRSCRDMRCGLHSNKGICAIPDRAIDFYPARVGEGSR